MTEKELLSWGRADELHFVSYRSCWDTVQRACLATDASQSASHVQNCNAVRQTVRDVRHDVITSGSPIKKTVPKVLSEHRVNVNAGIRTHVTVTSLTKESGPLTNRLSSRLSCLFRQASLQGKVNNLTNFTYVPIHYKAAS
jgi:hypothetical protein